MLVKVIEDMARLKMMDAGLIGLALIYIPGLIFVLIIAYFTLR